MAGKPISSDDLIASLASYQAAHPEAKLEKVAEGSYLITEGGDSIAVDLKDGQLSCPRSQAVKEALIGYIMDAREGSPKMPVNGGSPPTKAIIPSQPRKAGNGAMVKPGAPMRDIQVQEMTFEDIRNFLCPAANDRDTFMFLKLCQARNLNPFCNEAYLIPYEDKKSGEIRCSMVVGKEAFMRKAEQNSQYRGFKAGLILSKGEELIYREGTFQRKGETLEGGWCEVYRADRDLPVRAEVSLVEYDKGFGLWSQGKKATMIRKVAVVSGHREAFPSDLAGCYDRDEMGLNPENEVAGAA